MHETRQDRQKLTELIEAMNTTFQKNMDYFCQEQLQWREYMQQRIAALREPNQSTDPRIDAVLVELASVKQALQGSQSNDQRSGQQPDTHSISTDVRGPGHSTFTSPTGPNWVQS